MNIKLDASNPVNNKLKQNGLESKNIIRSCNSPVFFNIATDHSHNQ